MPTWRERAAPIVSEVIKEVGRSDLPVLRKALKEAYPFGERENHPYKAWLDEIKHQLGHSLTARQSQKTEPQGDLFK